MSPLPSRIEKRQKPDPQYSYYDIILSAMPGGQSVLFENPQLGYCTGGLVF